jgi:hypothetical protein
VLDHFFKTSVYVIFGTNLIKKNDILLQKYCELRILIKIFILSQITQNQDLFLNKKRKKSNSDARSNFRDKDYQGILFRALNNFGN